MTDYKKLLKELFEKYDEELALALDGNIEQYCYKEIYTKEYGTNDANYKNRLRLSYAILYTHKYEEHFRIDGLILKLFNEELFDRESNSFQGIGRSLEILTELMNKYDVPDREVLFERAKQANFDCYGGYNSKYVSPKLESYSLEEAVELLVELDEKELAKKLLVEYTYSNDICDEAKMYFCMRNFKNIGDVDNEIYCAKMLLNMEAMTANNYAICNRMLELLIIYNKNKQYDEASKVLDMLIPRLHSIDEWYNTGIGRNALEQCMDIILHTEDLAEDLWEWSEPILKQIIEKMHGSLYNKASFAAYKMGDFLFAEILSNKYDELMSPLG